MPSTEPLDHTSPEARRHRRSRFVVRGLRSVGYGAFIGLCIYGLTGQTLWKTLVHSALIGFFCWFFIDLGRMPVSRWKHRNAAPGTPEAESNWPGWPLMLLVVVVGSVLGFATGTMAADWITGTTSPGYIRGDIKQTVALVLGSLVPALVITYWFYSRETIAAHEAAAETAQRQAAENQLKLLESQLEPHMLFNTLANLRVLIAIDPPRAQQMLDQLIAFLRATLNASRSSSHPLEAEFARLRDYLALMELRMGERLSATFNLPEALAAAPVPPLLLQPLVENSIKHGLEPKVSGGRIDVSARSERDSEGREELVLTVRDTGVGLAESTGDGTHFGLVQVRERLSTLYGSRGRLVLESAKDPEGGAIATLRLPLRAPAPAPATIAPAGTAAC